MHFMSFTADLTYEGNAFSQSGQGSYMLCDKEKSQRGREESVIFENQY